MSLIYDRYLEQFTDYRSITTFWEDYRIADRIGTAAIKDTYERSMANWKHDYKYLTELVLVLNHSIWLWYEKNPDHPYVALYDELWKKASEHALNNLKGDELSYYLDVTD